MIKILWKRSRRVDAVRRLFEEARYRDDPLAHPALKAMSAAELADIPFPRPGRG